MKKSFFLVALFFISPFINAQEQISQADLSISSINLTVARGRYEPGKIVLPADSSQLSSNSNTVSAYQSQNKKIPMYLNCSVTIRNDNNYSALGTKLIVMLPPLMSAQVQTNNAMDYRNLNNSPYISYYEFNVGTMTAGQSITYNIFLRNSFLSPNIKVSAYVFGSILDPNPTNNYKDASY